MIAVGVDTHKRAARDLRPRQRSARSSASIRSALTARATASCVGWIRRLPEEVLVGSRARAATAPGFVSTCSRRHDVVEVERPKRATTPTERENPIRSTRSLAAKKVLAGDGLSTPRCGGTRQAMAAPAHRLSLRASASARASSTSCMRCIRSRPVALRERLGSGTGKQLASRAPELRAPPAPRTAEQVILEPCAITPQRAADLTRRRRRATKARLDVLLRGLDRDTPGRARHRADQRGQAARVRPPPPCLAKQRSHAATVPLRCRPAPGKRSDHRLLTRRRPPSQQRDPHDCPRPSTPPTPTPAPTSSAASKKARPVAKPCAALKRHLSRSLYNASSRST